MEQEEIFKKCKRCKCSPEVLTELLSSEDNLKKWRYIYNIYCPRCGKCRIGEDCLGLIDTWNEENAEETEDGK